MQVSFGGDMAAMATMQSQRKVKEQNQVALLKKMMQELQRSLQPPKNDQGSISLYA